jgi:hypothetical protein
MIITHFRRKLIDHCKTLPCFTCIVRPACFLGTHRRVKNGCFQYGNWFIGRDKIWSGKIWGCNNSKFENIMHFCFEEAVKELEKEKNK